MLCIFIPPKSISLGIQIYVTEQKCKTDPRIMEYTTSCSNVNGDS